MKSIALAAACIALLSVVFAGCGSATRHRILSAVFDGVPTPRPAAGPGGLSAANRGGRAPSAGIVLTVHAPYAARQCNACHNLAAGNALLAPRDQLCFRCHKLNLDRRYVHGPLASGGCLTCHDPHSSRFRHLLVSESETFCLDCHDRRSVAKNPAHEGISEQCTTCHDAHMSDKEYLLK